MLPPRQRTVLVLRYGVGPVRARSAREAARLLDVSRRRLGLVETRGVRSLARLGRRTACEQTGIKGTTLAAVYTELVDFSSADSLDPLGPALEAGLRLASTAITALEDEGQGAVAGVRESGGEEPGGSRREDEDASSAGPSRDTPFEELTPAVQGPLLVMLLAVVLACLAGAAREIRRTLR